MFKKIAAYVGMIIIALLWIYGQSLFYSFFLPETFWQRLIYGPIAIGWAVISGLIGLYCVAALADWKDGRITWGK